MLYYNSKAQALAALQRVRKAGANADVAFAQGGGWYVSASSVGQAWLRHTAAPRGASHKDCEWCFDMRYTVYGKSH